MSCARCAHRRGAWTVLERVLEYFCTTRLSGEIRLHSGSALSAQGSERERKGGASPYRNVPMYMYDVHRTRLDYVQGRAT